VADFNREGIHNSRRSLPGMGLLAKPILAREALFAYFALIKRLTGIYVPFVDVTDGGGSKSNSTFISRNTRHTPSKSGERTWRVKITLGELRM
jgi:hypothetical protein